MTTAASLVAQTIPAGQDLEALILEKDSIFWEAYNACEVSTMMSFVADDLEFYHDQGGQTDTRAKLSEIMSNGLCRSGNNEIERRPVAGTIKVFPIANVGAIISGQHTFHGIKNPDDEGVAYFFHLWKLNDGNWEMARVFSYDHQPLSAKKE